MPGEPDEEEEWVQTVMRCRMCGGTQISVYPISADEDSLQCAHCKHMTLEPEEATDADV